MFLRGFVALACAALILGDQWFPQAFEDSARSSNQAAAGGGLIVGQVVDAVTGKPIAGAKVIVTGSDWRLTDAEGRFVFFNVSAGAIQIVAEKTGYSSGAYGRHGGTVVAPQVIQGLPDGERLRLELAEGERRAGVVLRLWPYGAIAGRVVDEVGRPIVGVPVQAWPQVYTAGEPWLNYQVPLRSRTDDRGVYRLPEVLAGQYVVAVPVVSVTLPRGLSSDPAMSNLDLFRVLQGIDAGRGQSATPSESRGTAAGAGRWMRAVNDGVPPTQAGYGYGTTFYPASSSPETALPVLVAPGRATEGVDVQLRPEPTGLIEGTITKSGEPAPNVSVRLVSVDGTIEAALAVSDASGAFRFESLREGQYRAAVTDYPQERGPSRFTPRDASDTGGLLFFGAPHPASGTPTWCADLEVDVRAGAVQRLAVTLVAGARIAGTVTFRGQTPPPDLRTIARFLEIDRADGRPVPLRAAEEIGLNPDGTFISIGLPPGDYFIRAPQAPPGWFLESATFRGRDVSLVPLVLRTSDVTPVHVMFTDRPTVVQGTVRSATGNVASDASVVILPEARAQWKHYGAFSRQIVRQRVTERGEFQVRGLPEGRYLIAAVKADALAAWHSAALFQALASVAEPLVMAGTEARTINLTVRAVK